MTETPTDWQSVAAALNSQLAAEREKPRTSLAASAKTFNEYVHENRQLRDQLAAEQSRLAIEHEARLAVVDELAAEREKYADATKHSDKQDREIADLRRALKHFAFDLTDVAQISYVRNIAKAALEKVVADQPVQLPMINDDPVVTLK